ncbi:hypothetical protein GALMADRAFT_260786 [Galerina marginata CBS 339.88]|uniref:FMR1-interacting protein 1 conserved domain-containing protein n=1 Tax=Galerina marginata (strain CBS 339.88) TaxID=685588 RepID=A0A067TRY7_GALM3|nr:hypothetical protein GALMADRAFT_260786 [Galerina marginata CBS 339.88]
MYKSSLPPAHPSLPPQPASSLNTLYPQPGPSYPAYYNSHYVQAYQQPPPSGAPHLPIPGSQNRNANYTMQESSSLRAWNNNTQPIWYQTGNSRCSHPGCTFTGSHKTVEIHMMDRHLIYPPGWGNRKNKNEWDADPSLKGKLVPIQGTNIILDSPEVLEAWIAERKRRFPTAERIDDKKRKLEEAAARGQLDLTEIGRPNKRRNIEISGSSNADHRKNNKFRNNHGKKCRTDDGQRREQDSGWPGKAKRNKSLPEVHKIMPPPTVASDSESDSGDDGDEPEAVSSKIGPAEQLPSDNLPPDMTINQAARPSITSRDTRGFKTVRPQPKMPPNNPFASRPTLLRNLLFPEIRVTVSNLSQAIRFLVDNNFLRDVELRPGQVTEGNKIQVVALENTERDRNS